MLCVLENVLRKRFDSERVPNLLFFFCKEYLVVMLCLNGNLFEILYPLRVILCDMSLHVNKSLQPC